MKGLDAVFFYCDQCEILDPVIEKFSLLFPDKEVHTFSDIIHLTDTLKEKHPDYILVYLTKPDRQVMSAIKYLREDKHTASIPILTFHQLPTEQDMKDLYKKGLR